MAQDIIPMDGWKVECPCCGCKLEVEWQLATYADGGDSPQFVGLKQVGEITAEALRKKTYPHKVSFLARRGEQSSRRVSFTIRDTKTLSGMRCPKCNSRMRNTARRRYYCSHCKKDYKVILETIKSKIVPA